MLQWKRNHACEQRGQCIWKDYQRKGKTAGPNNESTGWWKEWMCHSRPPYCPKTNYPRNTRKRTHSVHNLPGCTKGLWQSMAGRNHIYPTQERSPWQKSENDKKDKLQSNCQDTNQVRTNQENQHQGQHKTRGSTISNRVCNPHGWNSQRTPAKKPRNRNTTELHPGLAAMDGWCMPDPPRPTKTTRNTRRNKPCRKQIPYPIWSCQM